MIADKVISARPRGCNRSPSFECTVSRRILKKLSRKNRAFSQNSVAKKEFRCQVTQNHAHMEQQL